MLEGEQLCTTLAAMGHLQPATPIQTDNARACGIVNKTFRQRRSRSMDLRFYWVRDHVDQDHFIVYWQSGVTNDADYFTKHHPTSHHRVKGGEYLYTAPPIARSMQGCVDLLPSHSGSYRAPLVQPLESENTFSLLLVFQAS
jgi:hypothetical protein